jgi:hypothetical protein
MNMTMAIDIIPELSAAGRNNQKSNKKKKKMKTKKLENFACEKGFFDAVNHQQGES